MGSVNNVSIGLSQEQINAIANILYAEALIGVVDGVNTVFNTTYSYQATKTYPYKNGQQQIAPADYTESADKEITFTFPPKVGDVLFIQYIRQSL
jgi:hypothetical protein